MWKYLIESIGIKIFFGISFIIAIAVVALRIRERTPKIEDFKDDPKIKLRHDSIVTLKNMFIGMLIGFISLFIVAQVISIINTRSISIYSEMAGLGLGFVGAVIGSLCGIIKWKKTT